LAGFSARSWLDAMLTRTPRCGGRGSSKAVYARTKDHSILDALQKQGILHGLIAWLKAGIIEIKSFRLFPAGSNVFLLCWRQRII
jgi:hypothetical protein